ncbi:NfeD family protein [Mangrovibacillus cuniculi]|uniref:Nodulation protein NfeD n=1 Tax=Mangrovibacillus cuniculi TaxID=2593652 RepID=A0A7S8CBI0_9BACI|nr:nodulation protein NfeD [Mangrovibacillus cuniculi]QPC46930.1 nodulation protein NfeD [Mangrovibacillus cuniculi]
MRRWLIISWLLLLCFSLINPIVTFAKGEQKVFVIPLQNEVEKGLLQFLTRGMEEAKEQQADYIVLDIDTPGGVVDAARDIGSLLDSVDIPIIAYVNPEAISAGAYISLHADYIYMHPNAQMGAAGVIDGAGNAAGQKVQSYWYAAMTSAAESHGRDPLYAQAMTNADIDLPKYDAGKGKFLTLTTRTAEEVGYSNGSASTINDIFADLSIENPQVLSVEETFVEKLARFITNPVVVPILLSIAGLGLVVELYSPGFGIAGTMGLSSLLLFFYGHLVAGLAGYEAILLFIIGAVLIILEFFVPGGILGILGALGVVGSILLAGGDIVQMGYAILISFVVVIVAMVVLAKVFGKRMRLWNRLILRDATTTELGYVSNVNRLEIVGRTAVTVTPLRPSGTIMLENERLDAVSEGGFLPSHIEVQIIKVEGSRIVVRALTQSKEE